MGMDRFNRAKAEHRAEVKGKIGRAAGFKDKRRQGVRHGLTAKFFRPVNRGPAAFDKSVIRLFKALWHGHSAVFPLRADSVADAVYRSELPFRKLADAFDNRFDHIIAGPSTLLVLGQRTHTGDMFQDEILFSAGRCKAHVQSLRDCLKSRCAIAPYYVRLK